ncbi:GtrA family protein [Streptomyces sp. NPDC049906]|uniref:GtrA family protein n=1 Tax=Streptomyces sp. NPDC049906 TaxID=3155656 RepID=UPI003436A5F1
MTVHASGDSTSPPDRRPPACAGARVGGRPRRLALEIAKFGVVGGSGVAVNLVVFNLLLHGLGSGPMTATVLASCAAMSSNYLGFRFFAYRDRTARTRPRVLLFFVFSGAGVMMESVLFSLAYHGAQLTGPLASNLAKALSIGLASAFRFLVYRTWVFPRPRPRTTGAHRPGASRGPDALPGSRRPAEPTRAGR